MKVKRFLSLALCAALASCIGLSACGEDDGKKTDDGGSTDSTQTNPVQLAAPQISLSDNVITWNAVSNADGYEVYEGETKVSTQMETSYTIVQTTVGSYVYTVYATSDDPTKFTKSPVSNSETYTVDDDDDDSPVQLAAPHITLNDNVITWSAVTNATGYEIYEGEKLVTTTSDITYTVTAKDAGKYDYTVYAVSTSADFTKSPVSNTVTYTVRGGDTSVTLASDKTIYVVGDSTVCDFQGKDNYYIQRYGYGTQLYNFLNLTSASQVKNLAISGRSSLSFLSEANYTTLKNGIGEGDYLIIGFGHNDEKSDDPARFTEPNGDYTTKGSFQYTLYENYVKLAKDAGATPILCTPIVRYTSGSYEGASQAHVTADGDYAAAIRKLGEDTNTAVVDLTQITKDYYTAHNEEAKLFHAYTTHTGTAETPDADKEPDGMDATHINKYGAKQIALWLLDNLPADCPLTAHVKITEELDADAEYADALNSKYVKPDYKGFDPASRTPFMSTSTNGTDVDWYKTAMGMLGGDKAGNYSFTKSDDKITIVTDAGSKFASGTEGETNGQDGFGALFVQIDVSKDFKATAKAKVTSSGKFNNQAAFGIMLRDDIYIDINDSTINSNFASASVTGGGKANMNRNNQVTLDYGGSIPFAADVEYEFSLVRTGQVVEVTVKQGDKAVTTKFTDVSYVGVDNNHIYFCLFANRGLAVEFSDVTFEITGDAQGA